MASQLSAQVVTRCCIISPLRSAAERLPPELVTEIFKFLDLRDLWRAAAVSRTFNASAWHAGLYIHLKFWWNTDIDYNTDVDGLREVVQHALHHDLRLGISFKSLIATKYDPAEEDVGYNSLELTTAILEMLSHVTTALPVLVHLSLEMTKSFCVNLDDALRHPAPRLESFCMSYYPMPVTCEHVVGKDLFAGFAPRLRRVRFIEVPLGPDPIRAFSRVSYSDIYHEFAFPDVDVAGHFPSVDTLRLAFYTESPHPPRRLNLDGLALKELVIRDCEDYSLIPIIDRSIQLSSIPVIVHEAVVLVWAESFWRPKNNDRLSIRLTRPVQPGIEHSDISIHILPEHRDWRRTFRISMHSQGSQCPIHDIPDVGKHLTYLRMDNSCLTGFLQCNGLALDALRNLHIDFQTSGTAASATMLWPPDSLDTLDEWERAEVSFGESDRSAPIFATPSYSYVLCRNLQTLRLFALDAPMRVESREAAFLGRALSQIPRPQQERAALALADVTFKEPIAHALLRQTFASVRWDYGAPLDMDGNLWDGCI